MHTRSRTAPIPPRPRWRTLGARASGPLLAALALAAPARAQDSGWRVRLEPAHQSLRGHDPHVLTIHEVSGATSTNQRTAVTLDTESGSAYRAELRYASGGWAWGAEFFWFQALQQTADLDRSGAGAGELVTFEVADRSYTSTGPGEVLYYRRLEDTELALWTLDLYAERVLAASDGGRLAFRVALRSADFDNDYRAAAGLEDVNGTRYDAESNYGRLTGPLVGLAGTAQLGRIGVDVLLGQSVVLGSAAYTVQARDFTGPFSGDPAYVDEEKFGTSEEIAIPITDLQARARYGLTEWLALGVGIQAAAWWDVGVPPGLLPVPGGSQVLQEDTLVLLGVSAVVELSF